MSATVELAREAEALREKIAAREHGDEDRLAEVEQELDERWEAEDRRQAEATCEYARILDQYLPAQQEAIEATRQFVDKVRRAKELRVALEAAGRKHGARSEPMPEKTSVRAARDLELKMLRQDARLAGGADF